MKLLFWNVHSRNLTNQICDIVSETNADVVVLLEVNDTASTTLAALRATVSADFSLSDTQIPTFQLFLRDTTLNLRETFSGDRLSLRVLSVGETDLLLGLVHIVDRFNWDEPQHISQVQLLAAELREFEIKMKHDRTILVGDFNMNPFDKAMNLATGMNAMMTRSCVERRFRVLRKTRYPFFYNPMWNLLGDNTVGPAGTFYHQNSQKGHYGWNMLDQVLVRPSAIKWFKSVEILSDVGSTSLATKSGRPDKASSSDHFPILLSVA